MELAKVLQLSRARGLLRDRLDDRHVEAARQLVGYLMKRLNAARSGRRRGNDHVELDAPSADELLGDGADLLDRGRVVSILQAVEQLPDLGAMRVELFAPEFVVAEELAAGGVEVEDATVCPWAVDLARIGLGHLRPLALAGRRLGRDFEADLRLAGLDVVDRRWRGLLDSIGAVNARITTSSKWRTRLRPTWWG